MSAMTSALLRLYPRAWRLALALAAVLIILMMWASVALANRI